MINYDELFGLVFIILLGGAMAIAGFMLVLGTLLDHKPPDDNDALFDVPETREDGTVDVTDIKLSGIMSPYPPERTRKDKDHESE